VPAAARQAVAGALPLWDWMAVTDVPVPVRLGHCAARGWPPELMPFLVAD